MGDFNVTTKENFALKIIQFINVTTASTQTEITTFLDIAYKQKNCVGDNATIYEDAFLPTGYSLQTVVLLCILVGIFCVYGLIGNTAVIVVIFTDKYLVNHCQNMYLVSLALADALLCALVIPFSLSQELLGTWIFGQTYCNFFLALDVMLCTASIWSICVIGLDRYWSICRPLVNRKKRTAKTIKVIIIMVSFIALVFILFSWALK